MIPLFVLLASIMNPLTPCMSWPVHRAYDCITHAADWIIGSSSDEWFNEGQTPLDGCNETKQQL